MMRNPNWLRYRIDTTIMRWERNMLPPNNQPLLQPGNTSFSFWAWVYDSRKVRKALNQAPVPLKNRLYWDRKSASVKSIPNPE